MDRIFNRDCAYRAFNWLYMPVKAKREHRFVSSQSVEDVRNDVLAGRCRNLEYLFKKRFQWMNYYIKPNEKGIELGSAMGLSRLYINGDYITTDITNYPWIDRTINALNMNVETSSIDYIIANNVVHHLSSPYRFFSECSRVLKPKGRLIIQDVNASLAFRTLLNITKHEGYSKEVDVFDPYGVCKENEKPWSANNAIVNLLFDDKKKFERHFPFKIVHDKPVEFFIWLVSGGVAQLIKTIPLPLVALNMLNKIDSFLIRISKKIFPMQRQIVCEKT